jgi:sugar phosphate isomerase/epimerase
MRICLYLLVLTISLSSHFRAHSQSIPKLGIVESIENDSLLHAAGFGMLGETVGKMLSPSLSEAAFEANLQKIKQIKSKLYLCNILFPGSMKITGPEVNEKRVLGYLDTVLYRAKRAAVPVIVLGSGGSRRLPEGYDTKLAVTEFTKLCKNMALVAKKHGVVIMIESLNSTETNFLNTVEQAAEIVKKVNHPNFRLNADIYHMLKENEPPQHIIDAGKLIAHVEIAEKEKRSFPGLMKEDFRPYFKALQTIGYKGPIFIEARTSNLKEDAPMAFKYLTTQLKEVYSTK